MSTFKPILFSTEMVKAILSGSKVQTRRVVKEKHQPIKISKNNQHAMGLAQLLLCPYGQVGDVLWVRESFSPFADKPFNSSNVTYKANAFDVFDKRWKWKPSIHMPKEACRLFLKIKSIRVERLQDISRGDAMDEGCPFPNIAKETFPTIWFEDLWKKINGEESWNSNPWVWVIEFERIDKPENFL